MKIIKSVDRDALTPEELDALDAGEKTEQDLISEWEKADAEERENISLEAQKAKELAENYKIRAEKAESKAKNDSQDKDTPKTDLSQTDLIALIKADIAEDDMEIVKDYATLKKISVAEAIKSSVIRTELAERKEERATAQATTTGNNRAGTSAASGNDLLNKAKSGELPESDEEMAALVEARFQSKIKK